MKVILLAHTPEPEKAIAAAARLCYSNKEISEIMVNFTEESLNKFIDKLVSLGHESPFEHVTFTFGIEGISRACSHQLVRHRIASYSQKSQRYCNENGFNFIVPDSILKNENYCYGKYNKLMQQINDVYSELIRDGIPAEDARYILPNACSTSLICTMNVRSLYNFFKLRTCNRAQWEIRELAIQMLKLCKEVSPKLFENAGAGCVTGHCPEGAMSCKKPIIDFIKKL